MPEYKPLLRRNRERLIKSVIILWAQNHFYIGYLDNCGNSRANTCLEFRFVLHSWTEEDAIIRFKLFFRRTVLMNLDNTSYQAERLGLCTGAIPFKSLPYQASIVG
jgi:hypothetical protein